VNNGQVVSPQGLKGSTAIVPPSINTLVFQINNDKDFDDYILKHSSKIPSVKSEVTYVKHPTLAVRQSQPSVPVAASNDRRTSLGMQPSQPTSSFSGPPQAEAQSPQQYLPPSQPEPVQQPSYPQSYNTGYKEQPQQPPPQPYQPPAPAYSNASVYSPVAQNPYAQPHNDFPRGPAGQVGAQQTTGVMYNNSSSSAPVNPVFGVTLEELFRRDGSPVPLVVYQCIQAVDLFGLEVEGIYRIPGTSSHIQAMKALFDSGMHTYKARTYTADVLV
jgi:hypothetical protein